MNACPLVCSLPSLRDKPNYYSQKKYLPFLKKDLVTIDWSRELLDFSQVPANTLQQGRLRGCLRKCKRVDETFKRYIKGDYQNKRSGKPRFKSSSRYRSLVFEGAGLELHSCSVGGKYLYLKTPKLGVVKIRTHRHIPDGAILKRAQFIKKADGWYVNSQLDDPTVPTPIPSREGGRGVGEVTKHWQNSLGLDAVFHENDYLATSDGDKLPSLKSYRKNHFYLSNIDKFIVIQTLIRCLPLHTKFFL